MADASWTVDEASAGVRLDKFLGAPDRLGSRGRAAAAIERGKVYVNDEPCAPSAPGRRLAAGDVVRVWMDKPGSARRVLTAGVRGDLDIAFEDDRLIVVNKPPGLLAVPLERRPDADSMLARVDAHLRSHGGRKVRAVHRIDEDTSGLVAFAKDERTHAFLQDQFRRRTPLRVYWAVMHGVPDPPDGTWSDRIVWDERALLQRAARRNDPRAQTATLSYRVLEPLTDASLVEVTLETGRRNQIRVQARIHGHPIVGETRYTSSDAASDRKIRFGRYALHARRLAFTHPDGRTIQLEAELPQDIEELMRRLNSRGF